MDWPQVVTITVSVVVAVIGSIAALAYFLGRRFERIDAQIHGLRNDVGGGLSSLASQFSTQLTLIGTLIRILHNRNALSEAEFREIQTSYTSFATRGVEDLISRAEARGNPLTGSEANRLRQYIHKARQGDPFTYEEIEDYNKLADRVSKEEPNDTAVWALVALGAFLLGVYIGTQGQRE